MLQRVGVMVGGAMLGLALVVVQATTPAGASPRAGRVPRDPTRPSAAVPLPGGAQLVPMSQVVDMPVRPGHPYRAWLWQTPGFGQVTNQFYSGNWSGFIDGADGSGSSITPDGAVFGSVSASFGVPTVEPSSTVAYTTSWVGIGGVFGNALLQGGTIEEWNGFGDQDTAFVEDYPNPALELQGLPVSPGDQISASVSESGGTWFVELSDATQGWSTGELNIAQTYQSLGYTFDPPNTQSAQWITEDPSCGSSLCPFADFTPVTSSSVADLTTSPVSRAPVEALMVNAEGAQRTMVSPSSIGSTAAATGTYANFTVSRPGESGTSLLSLFGLLGSLF